jgi:hypothetical protein
MGYSLPSLRDSSSETSETFETSETLPFADC